MVSEQFLFWDRYYNCKGLDSSPPFRKGYSQPFEPTEINAPLRYSLKARSNSSCVFITIGPAHATGSSRGLPETRRKRSPLSPAVIFTVSPSLNITRCSLDIDISLSVSK